jgi:hypothetical protein
MTRKSNALYITAAIFGGLVAASAAFAEGNTPSAQTPRGMQCSMGDHGSMMDMMGQMCPDHMAQMSWMISNCNRMMESTSTPPTHLPGARVTNS